MEILVYWTYVSVVGICAWCRVVQVEVVAR